MANVQKPASTSDFNEKKMKRMLSNRESARRSRARKQKHLEDLSDEESALQREIRELPEKIRVIDERFFEMESSNNALRARIMELISRFNSMVMMLQPVGQGSGYAVHTPETTDPLMRPWLPPFATVYIPETGWMDSSSLLGSV